MMKAMRCCALVLVLAGVMVLPAFAQNDVAQQAYDILKKNCFGCHGAAKTSGLDMRTADSLRAGGEHGRVIVPHEPDTSKLFLAVSHKIEPSMPPGKKLTSEDIDILREWI